MLWFVRPSRSKLKRAFRLLTSMCLYVRLYVRLYVLPRLIADNVRETNRSSFRRGTLSDDRSAKVRTFVLKSREGDVRNHLQVECNKMLRHVDQLLFAYLFQQVMMAV